MDNLESVTKEVMMMMDPNADPFYERMGCVKIGEKQSPMSADRMNTVYRYTGSN